MRYHIVTSAGASTGAECASVADACDVADAVHRPARWHHVDAHSARGRYRHNGADIAVAVLADSATPGTVRSAEFWLYRFARYRSAAKVRRSK